MIVVQVMGFSIGLLVGTIKGMGDQRHAAHLPFPLVTAVSIMNLFDTAYIEGGGVLTTGIGVHPLIAAAIGAVFKFGDAVVVIDTRYFIKWGIGKASSPAVVGQITVIVVVVYLPKLANIYS